MREMNCARWCEDSLRTFSLLAFSVLAVSLAAPWAYGRTRTVAVATAPRDVVQRYLASDLAGSRIFHDSQAATAKLVTWSEEPPWDQVIVVSHYTLTKSKSHRKKTKVGVRYSNLGELKGDVFFADSVTEDTTFGLVRRGRSWLVDRPILVPHISVATAQKYLQEQIKSLPPDSDRVKEINKTLDALAKLGK